MRARSAITVLPLVALSVATYASQAATGVNKQDVAGIRNFTRVETTIACAGATTADSMAEVKRLGFAAVINLRESTENGANVEAERAAAEAAGLRYLHIPFNSMNPDPAVGDKFLAAIKDPVNNPTLIHCASGSRAAAMWVLKRVMIDKWDLQKAIDEAASIATVSDTLKQFVATYAQTHR